MITHETKPARRIYRPNEACKLLGVSRPTLWRWRRDGILPPARKIGPNTIGWPEQELVDFIDSRQPV